MSTIFEKLTDDEILAIASSNIEDELRNRGYQYGWHKTVKYAGAVYILVNPAFPSLVKIGYADDVPKRVKALNGSSGIPDPYHIYAIYYVKHRLEDLKLHKLIDTLNPSLRHTRNKEFYEMSPEGAFAILSAIAEINGDNDLLIENPYQDEYFIDDSRQDVPELPNVAPTKTAKPLSFTMLNIPVGAELTFIEDASIKATVNGDNSVTFEGQSWHLSSLVRMLKIRNGTANASGAYRGGKYWLYHGEDLVTLRAKQEEVH